MTAKADAAKSDPPKAESTGHAARSSTGHPVRLTASIAGVGDRGDILTERTEHVQLLVDQGWAEEIAMGDAPVGPCPGDPGA